MKRKKSELRASQTLWKKKKKKLKLENYIDALFDETKLISEINLLRSQNHRIYCEYIKNIGLSCFDDKRYILDDGLNSLPCDH